MLVVRFAIEGGRDAIAGREIASGVRRLKLAPTCFDRIFVCGGFGSSGSHPFGKRRRMDGAPYLVVGRTDGWATRHATFRGLKAPAPSMRAGDGGLLAASCSLDRSVGLTSVDAAGV